jgi:hypothetical protein
MWIDNDNDFRTGDIGFLIEIEPQGQTARTTIRRSPGAKNMSGERVLAGWLGTTNNISHTARGVGRVTAVTADGDRARVTQFRDADLEAALETLGYPNLLT